MFWPSTQKAPPKFFAEASFGAFAALRSDGRVVTWGNDSEGGDSSSAQDSKGFRTCISLCRATAEMPTKLGRSIFVHWIT